MLRHFQTDGERLTFAGSCVLFGLAVVVTVLSVSTQIGRPAPGFVVWRNLVVPAIGAPGWSSAAEAVPLRSVLVAADGLPVTDADALRALVRAKPPGTPVTYTFERAGERLTATVPTTVLRWRDVLPTYAGYFVDGLVFFATALIVFYMTPRLPAARACVALGAVLGMTLMLALDLFSAFWLQRLYFCFESLMPAPMLHFVLAFPEEKEIVRRHPWLYGAIYLPFGVLALLQNLLLGADPARHLMVNTWVYTATGGAVLVSVASLVHSYLVTSSPLARQQAKVVIAGAVTSGAVPALGLLSITLLGLQIPMNQVVAPFVFIYPLSIGYAIVRHDLFSVDRYLRLGVVYAALSLVVFLTYAGIVLAAEAWMGGRGQLPPGLVPVYLLAVLIGFDPLRSRIQALVDRLFHRQAYSYRATVEATSRALASVLNTERIATTVLATLTDVMGIEWAVLLLLADRAGGLRAFGRPATRAAAAVRVFPSGDDLLPRLARSARPVSRDDLGGAGRDAAVARLGRFGASLALPVRFQDEPIGVLLIGDKQSGTYYTDTDLNLLGTLTNQTALALTNARAYEIIRRTQAELVQAERLAAVGELAAAVAHGIRNPLAGIRATAQVAREDLGESAELAESLDDIIAEADRLERRVRTILDVARPAEPTTIPVDLGRFLREFEEGMRRRLPAGVTLTLDAPPELPPVVCDLVQLDEVIETIVVNAVEAMGARGAIRLGARLESASGVGRRAVITVADSGPGIEAGARGRLFDLFFTTKPAGTGVGLAMAKRLVERQGGTIEVESSAGHGATFSIRLAVAEPGATGSG